MNLSISNTSTIGRKNLKNATIVAAAVSAIAATAVFAGVPSFHRSAPSGPVAAPASISAARVDTQAPATTLTYYVTSSPEQAAELRSLLSSENAAFGSSPSSTAVVVDSPDSRRLIGLAALELMTVGQDVQVFDLTAPEAQTPASVTSDDIDGAVMQGVISSERAAWAFDDDAVAPRTVSDEALLAGVISSEHAAWIFPAE